ncbi:MAG: lytic transglycosylase domain-containing protein [Defluviitaleaceae bacterium]|nr:lytic transglycosylase domain-containing protein [Defluviitaleaceae bacterium]
MKKFLVLLLVAVLCVVAAFMAVRTRFPIRHLDVIEANAGSLDASFILAVIMAESSFNPNAQSRVGAQGLMQLMPPTAADMAARMGMTDFAPEDVWDPEVNIALGTFYLNWLYNRYDGNLDLVLAAYNAGLGRVDSWLRDPALSADGQTLDVIPFPETYNYLNRIRQFQRIYRVLLPFYRR